MTSEYTQPDFELTVYLNETYHGDDGPYPIGPYTLNVEQLDAGIANGSLYEGIFNRYRCNSTWGPVFMWPEEYQGLKTEDDDAPADEYRFRAPF